MKFKYLIFDFDGTLCDSIKGITLALNRTFSYFNISRTVEDEETKTFIGDGAKILFLRAFKMTEDLKSFEPMYAKFLEYYGDSQSICCPSFKNVNETIKKLKMLGYKNIIYSNKPEQILLNCCKKFLNIDDYDYVYGITNEREPKPCTNFIESIINREHLNKDEIIYIGDSHVDYEFSQKLNVNFIFCNYGYGKINKSLNDIAKISKFEDIVTAIEYLEAKNGN